MNRLHVLPLAAVACLALAGCSSADPAPRATAPNVDAATPAAARTDDNQEHTPRGNLAKEIGEPFGIHADDNRDRNVVTYVVKGIEVDPQCTNPYPQEPEHGRFIAVDMEVETAADPEFTEVMQIPISPSAHSFKMIDANGTTVNSVSSGPSYGCLNQSEMMPSQVGPDERATGKIILDVPSAEGTLIYREAVMADGGWEFEIPAE